MKVFRQFARGLTVAILVSSLCVTSTFAAQTHVVSQAELQSALLNAVESRQKNVSAILSALSAPRVEKALRSAHVDLTQVKTVVASLSDDELARIAARTNMLQADVAGGRLSDRDLLLILIGLAALILIIVAVD